MNRVSLSCWSLGTYLHYVCNDFRLIRVFAVRYVEHAGFELVRRQCNACSKPFRQAPRSHIRPLRDACFYIYMISNLWHYAHDFVVSAFRIRLIESFALKDVTCFLDCRSTCSVSSIVGIHRKARYRHNRSLIIHGYRPFHMDQCHCHGLLKAQSSHCRHCPPD